MLRLLRLMQVSLAFLHQQNVVHADIKPENLCFVAPHGGSPCP